MNLIQSSSLAAWDGDDTAEVVSIQIKCWFVILILNLLGKTAEVFNSLLRGPEATKRLSFNNGLLHYTSHVSKSSWCQRTSVCKFQKNNFRKLMASSFFHKTAEFCFDETRCCGKHANICIFFAAQQRTYQASQFLSYSQTAAFFFFCLFICTGFVLTSPRAIKSISRNYLLWEIGGLFSLRAKREMAVPLYSGRPYLVWHLK